jgi:hypothetical protein
MRDRQIEVLEAYVVGWLNHGDVGDTPDGRRNLERLLDVMAPDVVWEDVPSGHRFEGHAGIVDMCTLVYERFRPHLKVVSRQTDGKCFAIEWEATLGVDGTVIRGIARGAFGTDGKVTLHRDYWDRVGVTASTGPAAHPDPQNLSDLFAGLFQTCWTTGDLDAGLLRLRSYGMVFDRIFDPIEVRIDGSDERVLMRASLGAAADGSRAVEIIQPLVDPTGVFTAPAHGMEFHHLGIWINDLEQARVALGNDGLEFVWTGRVVGRVEFGIVDLRAELGHCLELVRRLGG